MTSSRSSFGEILRILETSDGSTCLSDPWIAVRYSPDGSRIIAVPSRGPIVVWDSATAEELFRIPTDECANLGTQHLAFSQDGTQVAVALVNGGASDRIRIYELRSGKLLNSHDLGDSGGQHIGIDLSGDGTEVAIARQSRNSRHEGLVLIINSGTGKEIATLVAHHEITGLSYSPNGRYLATSGKDQNANGGRVKLWDAKTHQIVAQSKVEAEPVTDVKWFPDSFRLLSVSDAVRILRFDETAKAITREPSAFPTRWTDETDDHVKKNSVRLSQDASVLALVADQYESMPALSLWSIEEKRRIVFYQGDIARDLAFSPDGKRFLTAMGVNEKSRICEWDLKLVSSSQRSPVSSFEIRGDIRNLGFAEDSQSLVGIIKPNLDDSKARLLPRITRAGVFCMKSSDGSVRSAYFPGQSGYLPEESLGYFFPEQQRVLVWSSNPRIPMPVFWDPATSQTAAVFSKKFDGINPKISVVRAVPSGNREYVIWCCHDPQDAFSYVATDLQGKVIHQAEMKKSSRPVVSNQGSHLLFQNQSEVNIIDIKNEGESGLIPASVTWGTAAFSPDSKYVVGIGDGVWRYHVASGDIDFPFGHLADRVWSVYSLAFTKDGRFLATGTRSGNIQIWSLVDGQLLGNLGDIGRGDEPPEAVAFLEFDANGTKILSAKSTEEERWTVETWDITGLHRP